MKKEHQAAITEHMRVKPQLIDSYLVSAQNRKRLYWFNWQVPQPEDKGILLTDILLPVFSEDYLCSPGWHHWWEKKQFQLQKKYSQIGNQANKASRLLAVCMPTGKAISSKSHNISSHRSKPKN